MDLSVIADVRLTTGNNGKVLAHASVTLAFGADGQMVVDGFSVLDNGKGPWVAPPARKGDRRYFPVVTLSGRVRADVERAVLTEFERQRGASGS